MAQIKLAEYTFDNSVGDCLPTLRLSSIEMTTEDIVSGVVTRRTVYIDDTTLPYQLYFQNQTALLTVDYLHIGNNITNLASLFSGCTKLKTVNTTNWDLSSCTNISFMFQNCSSLTKLDLRNWVTSSATTMQGMFHSCTSLIEIKGIEGWDTSSVTAMNDMFNSLTQITELNLVGWDTRKVTSKENVFYNWTSDQIVYVHDTDFQLDVSSYNATFVRRLSTLLAKYTFDNSIGDCLPTFTGITTSDYKVSDIVNDTITTRLLSTDSDKVITKISFGSLGKTSSLLTVDHLKIDKNITQMNDMFQVCSNVTTINAQDWDTSNVTNMAYLFQSCGSLTEIIGLETWDTSKVEYMNQMFVSSKVPNVSAILNWNVSNCKSFAYMFSGANSLDTELNLSNWQPNNLESTQNMFATASFTSINLSGWNVPKLSDMRSMFAGHANQPLQSVNMSNWTMETPANMNSMFYNNPNLTSIDFTESKMVSSNLSQAFQSCSKLTSLDVSGFDLSNCNTIQQTFCVCSLLEEIKGLENWDVSNVTTMSQVFASCTVLTNLDSISNWNTSKVLYMYGVFSGCKGLTSLNVNSWDVSKVTTLQGCFGDLVMDSLDLSNWNVSRVGNFGFLFSGTKIKNINVSGWDTSAGTNFQYLFTSSTAFEEVDLSGWKVSSDANLYVAFNGCSTNQTIYYDPLLWQASRQTNITWTVRPSKNNGYWLDMTGITGDTTITLYNENTLPTEEILTDWGDGTQDSELTHTYSTAGEYVVVSNLQNSAAGGDGLRNYLTKMTVYYAKAPSSLCFNYDKMKEIILTNNWAEKTIEKYGQKVSMTQMFRNCPLLELPNLEPIKQFKPTYCVGMFYNCKKFTSIDLTEWDLSNCTSMELMFSGCVNLTEIKGIENLNVSKSISFNSLFAACSSLTSLDLSSWDTSSCTDMNGMFRNCTKLIEANLSSLNTSNVTNMSYMFNTCSSLQRVNFDGWDTSSVTNLVELFAYCNNLEELDMSMFVTDKVTSGFRIINSCPNLKTLDISNISFTDGIFHMNINSLTTIGMVYCDADSINRVTSSISSISDKPSNITIYYYDADPSQLTPVEGVTFKKYGMPTTIQLPPHIQLHSLPDGTRDEVDIKTGILTRNVGYKVYDENMTWGSYDVDFYYTSENIGSNTFVFYSNDLKQKTSTQLWNGEEGYMVDAVIGIRKSGIKSKEEFLDYISKNPKKVVYALAEPTKEQLILNYNNSCDYGRILPTGICDKYDVVNSMYTQTMTSIPLNGVNTWDDIEDLGTVLKFTATGTTVGVDNLNMKGAGGLYCDNDLFPNINDDSDVEHCRVDEEGNKFYIYVDKERLMSPDLIGWQIWLQTNPFNMWYELEEHLIYTKPYEELDATQARWEGMDCIRDGAIKYHANNSDNITIYPTLEYVAPSINNFEVTMLEPNTDYTIYAEGINEGDTINLGGTDINFNNGTVYTSGDNQWLRIDNNDSFYNMVITKGDTTGEVVPYFEGMTSVENPKVQCGESIVSYTDLKLRSLPNGVKDTVNVLTGEYVQRIGEIVLDGSDDEDWVVNGYNGTNVQNTVGFRISIPNIKKEALSSVINNRIPSLNVNNYYNYIVGMCVIVNDNIPALHIRLSPEITGNNLLIFKQWLSQNPITVQYQLAEPITTKLDPQTLLAYTGGTINLSSDTGLLPTTHYSVPSTNTFNLPSMKTGTRYTLKYPSASGSITIGDITYSISSNSMLFTTPLKINGDTSAIIFSDANPENVILLEGAYNTREVPYFTGVKSVKNPNITIIDQLSTESTTYNCETEIELRGLPNGVADKLDFVKGKLTTVVGVRDYQEGDEELDNVWTDGYETVYALSSPAVTNVAIDHPTVTTSSLIELSSDYLIPQLNYRAPSSNNFPLDLLQSNTTYTLYADTLVSGNYTLGGTKTGIYSQPHTITLGDMTDNLLTFNGDLGLSNVMLVKGNSLKTTLPPYFLGIRSVTDGHLLVEGMAGEINELTFDEGIVLRDCNGVKDAIDLITCTLTKRTGEITLTGAEGWYRADSESTTDYNVFKLTLGGLKEALVMCDTLQSVFDTKMMDCIHAYTNELCIVIANATIGGNTVNALKSWLNQHPTTVVYQLRVPIEVQLENVWTTTPPTSYSNQTEISSTVSTNSLKPMISVTIATTTLEEIVSDLEAQNAELEAENTATMLALTSVYETLATPAAVSTMSLDDEVSTVNLSDGKDGNNVNGMSVSPIGMVYVNLIRKGLKTIEQVPYNLQPEVMYALRGME